MSMRQWWWWPWCGDSCGGVLFGPILGFCQRLIFVYVVVVVVVATVVVVVVTAYCLNLPLAYALG